jgi:SWI/SNF-related matrix-associated actin-dependent regulator 1 of chromatin subfamily A
LELKPFQLEGAAFLAQRSRALLADEPGVGKTGQLIHAARLIGANKIGVVCPEIGMEHWRREIRKWGFTGHADVIGWGEAHKVQAAMSHHDWLAWDVLIPDESHFGKNPHARRTKAVFAKGGLAWRARRIWAASGTPAPNNASELWPLLRAFGHTKMDLDTFTRYFCYVDDQGKVRGNRPDHIAELRAILKSFSLRRLKKDVLPELGAIDIQEWYVKPDARFAAGSASSVDEEALRRHLAGMSDEDMLIFLAGDQEFATLRRYNALLKAPAVFDTVKFEYENGLLDKVVVFGHHKEALAVLHKEFLRAGIPAALINGDTPQRERDGLIEEWKRTGVVLLASLTIASTALDLTAAHQVIALEMDWVPGTNWQAWQRPHRQGQTQPVTVRVAMGTPIDEIVNDVLIRKIRDLAEIFD